MIQELSRKGRSSEKYLFGAVLLTFAVLGIILFSLGPQSPRGNAIVSIGEPLLPARLSVAEQIESSMQEKLLGQPWGRNPFAEPSANPDQPAVQEETLVDADPREFVLSGIIVWQKTKMAVINGVLVEEGDWVRSAEVLRIDSDQVLLKKGPQKILVRLAVAQAR